MKKLSRILALVLALTMVAALFVGCSKSDNKGSASGEKTVLKVMIFDRGKSYQNGDTTLINEASRYINEKFGKPNNIEVEFIPIPRSTANEKLNLLLAGQQAPDIIYTYDQIMFYKYAGDGGLTDVMDMVKDYPNIEKWLMDSPFGCLDGGRFGLIPDQTKSKDYKTGQFTSFIRKDWLDKLDLKVPTNPTELYEVLKAFRDADPKVLGTDKIIPMGMTAGNFKGSVFQNSLALYDSFRGKMTDEEFATLPYLKRPGWKEGTEFLNKLYNEKLLDQDFALQNDFKVFWQQISKGQVGFWTIDTAFEMNDKGAYATLYNTNPDAEIIPIHPFPTADGKYVGRANNNLGIITAIPKTCKNPEAAMKYLDWMLAPENNAFICWGEEGRHYKVQDGVKLAGVKNGLEEKNWPGDYFPQLKWQYPDEKSFINEYKVTLENKKTAELASQARDMAMHDELYFEHFFLQPIQAESKHGANLAEKQMDILVKTITCAPADFSAMYDKMVQEYMDMGGQEVMDEKLDAYKAEKK